MSAAFRTLTSTYLRLSLPMSLPMFGMLIAGPWFVIQLIWFQSGMPDLNAGHGRETLQNNAQLSFYFNFVLIMFVGAGAIAWVQLPEIVRKAKISLLPVSNRVLGTFLWLVPACVLMVSNAIVQQAYAWLFESQWPILTTTLCFGVSGMLLMAILWWLWDFRFYKVPLVIGGLVAWSYWFAAHFHPNGLQKPPQPWDTLSIGDAAFLVATAAGSWWLTVAAFAKYRCGEAELGNLLKLLQQPPYAIFLARRTGALALPKSETAFAGLLAMEWTKGRVISICTAMLLSVFLCLCLLGAMLDRGNPQKAVTILLPMMGILCGMLSGLCLGMEASGDMKPFYSTLPFTDADLSRAFLQTCRRCSLLSSVIMLAIAVLAVCGYAAFVDPVSVVALLSLKSGGIVGGILMIVALPVMAWVACGLTASITTTGRPWVQGLIPVAGSTFLFAVIALPVFYGPWGENVATVLALICLPAAGILGTVWLFAVACRKDLIPFRDTIICGAIAIVLMLSIWLLAPIPSSWKFIWCGIACTIVTPIAALPVALSSNRHR